MSLVHKYIYGTMFAGKTSALIDLYNAKKDVSYLFKIGGGEKKVIESRDHKKAPCISVNGVQEVMSFLYQARIYKGKPAVLVDEIQFADVKDIQSLIGLADKYVFTLILSGLDFDYLGDAWPSHHLLKSHVDFGLVNPTVKCKYCDERAVYSKRLFASEALRASGEYAPVCGAHFE